MVDRLIEIVEEYTFVMFSLHQSCGFLPLFNPRL